MKGLILLLKILILLPVIIMSWMSDFFHPGIVSGYVKNIDTGKPIQGATIRIYEDVNGDYSTHGYIFFGKTDKDGFFNLKVMPRKYSFYVEIPKVGVIASTLGGGPDFHDFEIKKDQHIKFIISVGKRRLTCFEKKVSQDGSEIRMNMLYSIINK